MSAVLELVIVCDECTAQGGSVWQFKMNPAQPDLGLMRDRAAELGWRYDPDSIHADLCPPHAKKEEM